MGVTGRFGGEEGIGEGNGDDDAGAGLRDWTGDAVGCGCATGLKKLKMLAFPVLTPLPVADFLPELGVGIVGI